MIDTLAQSAEHHRSGREENVLRHAFGKAAARRDAPVTAPRPDVRSVLVVEDEPMIAMDIEHTLECHGFVVEICPSRSAALEWLATQSPVFAILDVWLKDGTSAQIASLLRHRNIPFAVCSGLDRRPLDDEFAEARWMRKPHDPQALIMEIRAAVAGQSHGEERERQG